MEKKIDKSVFWEIFFLGRVNNIDEITILIFIIKCRKVVHYRLSNYSVVLLIYIVCECYTSHLFLNAALVQKKISTFPSHFYFDYVFRGHEEKNNDAVEADSFLSFFDSFVTFRVMGKVQELIPAYG